MVEIVLIVVCVFVALLLAVFGAYFLTLGGGFEKSDYQPRAYIEADQVFTVMGPEVVLIDATSENEGLTLTNVDSGEVVPATGTYVIQTEIKPGRWQLNHDSRVKFDGLGELVKVVGEDQDDVKATFWFVAIILFLSLYISINIAAVRAYT